MRSGEFHTTYASDMAIFETRRARRALAVFLAGHGVPFLIACPLSGAVAAVAGMIFGIPSLRLKGLYLAMATLAAHFIVEFTMVHWESVTGGVNGTSVPAARIFAFALDSDTRLFYLIASTAVVLVFFAKNLFRTKVGKAFIAIRDQDISAEVMGVNVYKHK